jgi:hypothetical protein
LETEDIGREVSIKNWSKIALQKERPQEITSWRTFPEDICVGYTNYVSMPFLLDNSRSWRVKGWKP